MPIDPQIRRQLPVEVEEPPVAKLLGMELAAVGAGTCTYFLDVDERFHNPMGSTHGGILGDLADITMGTAVISTLAKDETYTTLEQKVTFLRPVFSERLQAQGRVGQRGRTIVFTECDIVNQKGKVVAQATATHLVIKREGAREPFRHKPRDGGQDGA